jgi:hypothetical protein
MVARHLAAQQSEADFERYGTMQVQVANRTYHIAA